MNDFTHDEYRKLKELAAGIPQKLRGNLKPTGERDTPVLLAGACYNGLWLEHNQDCFFACDILPENAWESIKIVMDYQEPDGLLPYSLRFFPFTVGTAQLQTVWSFARCALETARKLKRPEADFARIYEAGIRYDSWLTRHRNHNKRGLVEMFCTFDTGHDNSRRVKDGGIPNACPERRAENMPDIPVMPVISVDLSAARYGGLTALAELADMLDKSKEANDLRQQADNLKNLIHEELYCAEDEFFYDRSPDGFRKYRTEHITRLFLNKVVDQTLFDRIYERCFASENEFFTPFPFPSVSASDPSFNTEHPANCWGGNTQMLTLLRSVLWMEKYGRKAELEEIMRRTLKAFLKFDNPFAQELHPFTGEPIGFGENYTPALLFFRECCQCLKILEKNRLR